MWTSKKPSQKHSFGELSDLDLRPGVDERTRVARIVDHAIILFLNCLECRLSGLQVMNVGGMNIDYGQVPKSSRMCHNGEGKRTVCYFLFFCSVEFDSAGSQMCRFRPCKNVDLFHHKLFL